MKKIGIVICNYNKQDYIMDCIRSVFESSFKDFDVYVVDNASTDDSVKLIRETYGDRVTLIVNESNLGGSGGFNSGLRKALQGKYRYLMCVDNDIVMDADNIRYLYEFLEEHEDVGMVGSKILRMQQPERLQELGADLVFEKGNNKTYFKDHLDTDEIPEVQYCHYVPACSLMIRTSVIEKIGIMPDENFIYWDDMEWGYKVNLAGYKVAAYSKAKVWHAMSAGASQNYFTTYYFWRNRIAFFLKYTPADKKEAMMQSILENLFQTLYGCYYKKKSKQISIIMGAYDDALHERTGKTDRNVYVAKDEVEDRLGNLVKQKEEVWIEFDGNYKLLQMILLEICKVKRDIKVCIFCEDVEAMRNQHPECDVCAKDRFLKEEKKAVLRLCQCEHVSKVKDTSLRMIYIDEYMNLLAEKRDLDHFAGYNYTRDLFMQTQSVLMNDAYEKMNLVNS